MSSPSFSTVFGIVELLESILFQLTLKDLLRAQRVNHRWHELISTLPSLQQKLFFQPQTPSSRPHFNPLLESLFPPILKLSPRSTWDSEGSSLSNRSLAWFDKDFVAPTIQDADSWFQDNSRCAAILYPYASWRKMFPVQPPAKFTWLWEKSFDDCTYITMEYEGIITPAFEKLQDDGVRMGLMYDLVVHMVDGFDSGEFMIDWKMFPPTPSNIELEEGKGNEVAVNEIHILFYYSDCWGRCKTPVRSGLEIAKFDEDQLLDWNEWNP